jgi:CHAT domain
MLVLRAVDVADGWRWRWLLSDGGTGQALADQAVELEPGDEDVAAFGDLYECARWRAAPDRRDEEEARVVARAGAWAGRVLLGEAIGGAIVAAAPVTVRVEAPAGLEHVLGWPLELAHAGGAPLAALGEVAFVYDIAAPDGTRKDPVGESLRVLAVFSQPVSANVLALRRERYALARLIRRIVARGNALVELRVVHYGATRERLARIVGEAPGWDVLHLSGRGAAGTFLLERADGSPDPVSAGELIGLLRPARRRVKLAVVSACESAAGTTAQTLRLIGLDDQAEAVEASGSDGARPEVAGLTRALVAALGCAVVNVLILSVFTRAGGVARDDRARSEGLALPPAERCPAIRGRSVRAGQAENRHGGHPEESGRPLAEHIDEVDPAGDGR